MCDGAECVMCDGAECVSVQGLNVTDLEDLLEDIEVYRTIEKDTNLEFWKVHEDPLVLYYCYMYMYIVIHTQDMMIVCEDEIQKLKKMERAERGTMY